MCEEMQNSAAAYGSPVSSLGMAIIATLSMVRLLQ